MSRRPKTKNLESDLIEDLKRDPLLHLEQAQGITTLLPYQRTICNLVRDYDRVAIKSCHDTGKTYLAARLVLWFGSTNYPCKGITTAPTFRQVANLLWSEIRTGHQNSKYPLGGHMKQIRWDGYTPDWFILGYSPQKEAGEDITLGSGSTFQGFHSPNEIIVFDEATGVPKQVWDQSEGMTTGGRYKMIAIGNPTSKACEFFKCFPESKSSKAKIWKQFSITCFDSPNVYENGLKCEADLAVELALLQAMTFEEQQARMSAYVQPNTWVVTARWVMERAMEWGLAHPLFRSKALAEFPDEDDNALFTLSQITNATTRPYERLINVRRRSIGVDPARFGGDKTIITLLEDDELVLRKTFLHNRTTETAGEVINLFRERFETRGPEHEGTAIVVDSTGIGAGVVDMLEEAARSGSLRADIIEAHFGGGAAYDRDPGSIQEQDKERFVNFKAKIFQYLSRDLTHCLKLPGDEREHQVYQEQLPTINYSFDSKGRLKIESKEDYKKRTGRTSPDESDSLALANWGRHVKLLGIETGPRAFKL